MKSLIDTFQNATRFAGILSQKLMGKIASGYKKRRCVVIVVSPERLELFGTLRQHKANVWVALDMSGSITGCRVYKCLRAKCYKSCMLITIALPL